LSMPFWMLIAVLLLKNTSNPPMSFEQEG
jgi:hypothetical protein